MSKQTDIRLCELTSSTDHINFRAPIKFGGRVVTNVVLLNVTVADRPGGDDSGRYGVAIQTALDGGGYVPHGEDAADLPQM